MTKSGGRAAIFFKDLQREISIMSNHLEFPGVEIFVCGKGKLMFIAALSFFGTKKVQEASSSGQIIAAILFS